MKLLKGNIKTDDNRVQQHTEVYSDSAHLHDKLVTSYFCYLAPISFVSLHLLAVKKKKENVFAMNI